MVCTDNCSKLCISIRNTICRQGVIGDLMTSTVVLVRGEDTRLSCTEHDSPALWHALY
jgi:hypothetical protein